MRSLQAEPLSRGTEGSQQGHHTLMDKPPGAEACQQTVTLWKQILPQSSQRWDPILANTLIQPYERL